MALRIPAVVSPVAVNTEIVRDGVNGFLASTPDQWIESVERLLRDPKLRGRLGAEARRTVEERYSAHVHAPRLNEILHQVATE
jgi:glycosyltransferase involved in cell wall biosynthesis